MNTMSNPGLLFLSVAISIGVFLLLREVMCWYFKINARLKISTDIRDELKLLNAQKDIDLTSKETKYHV